jgi:mannose-6-phosphate isomerase-like protein (cupin superfamily)
MTSVHEEVEVDTEAQQGKRKITWFDEEDSVELAASGAMSPTALRADVIKLVAKSELHRGNGARVLFQDPDTNGFSMVHAWFGENFPLPRHTHSGDCLYYVLKGELRMGSKTVKAGSGFFVPSGRPYTYRAGPGGVEVIEFRNVSAFDMITLDQDVAKWESYTAIGDEMAGAWDETRPGWVDRLDAGEAVTANEPGAD